MIEFQMPVGKPDKRGRVTECNATETHKGTVALLKLGEGRLKTVIHDGILTDYRSGRRIATLQAVKIEFMARVSTYHRITDRQAAQITLDRIVAKAGLEKVRAIIDGAPQVNH